MKIDLTQEEVNAILTILGDMPTKTGLFPLVMKIKVQADALIAAEQKEQEAAQLTTKRCTTRFRLMPKTRNSYS